jgi:fructose-bisphosphate aldolase class 1
MQYSDETSNQQWISMLLSYGSNVKSQLDKGCKPNDYEKLMKLTEALDTVIQRLIKKQECENNSY